MRDRSRRPDAPRVVVQQRGRTRVLRVDGSFASVWRADRVFTRSVWDALAAPVLALPPARRRDVLILGLGGGSVARLLRAIVPAARILGVELDREVIAAARRHFELDALALEIRHEDARRVLARRGRRFDLVIDDVFVGEGRGVHKPDWIPEPGLALALRRLRAGGLLVVNALDEAPRIARWLAARLPALLELRVDGYDNRVFVASTRPLDARALRRAMAREPALAPALGCLRLRALSARRSPSSDR